MQFIEGIREKFIQLVEDRHLSGEEEIQVVSARPLTPEEAIGRPERQDFPLLKGKEVMLQATFAGAVGQAYTDMPGNYQGTLKEVLALPLRNNYERAIFIATLNAVMRHLKLVDKTNHCRDQEPGRCAARLVEYVRERFGNPRIAFIGLQPAMVACLAGHFPIRVTDLDPDNVGQRKNGIIIEDARHTAEIIEWSDLILATGTTAVNDTLPGIVGRKPVVFYGVTISGIARLVGYEQYCSFGH
ncbi:hypothetical protein MTAT_08080 [Moorella thermoacetica]|uniref:Putative heavy-metal chelation domain-containing protein n=1 Tax=Neomoorella thermoacetica TaxID=1525 RepID=A0A1D7XB75_NEOTH|nr:DUF364 domain-containing protein [Moorella thermoacetica]AOQ24167.1 hypothetical protein Maut_01730 [Moorella thermoacetica]OIQ07888.1 hypothetical protein MOOR_25050 [Moorella thermoacetica]OIQ61412.1 hypothetical protein MTIN_14880 [Moorella thermoacetica]TYL14573.1 hypothetical protein MTAT_08080 [Moorella thermoacetica]